MKKYLALLFVFLMLLSLAACGGGSSSADASSSSESTSESDSQETAPEENIKEEPVSFEISEYGYGIEDGYLFISAVLHNPSDKVIELPGPFEISLYMPSLVTDTYEVCAFPW